MAKHPFKGKIHAQGTEITVLSQGHDDDFISLTDIARFKNADEADLLNVALFGQTAAEWRKANSGKDGNLRDHANLENTNALFIEKGLLQSERIAELNRLARVQMAALLKTNGAPELRPHHTTPSKPKARI